MSDRRHNWAIAPGHADRATARRRTVTDGVPPSAAPWLRRRLPIGVLSSVRVQLTLWYIAILALVLVLCGGALYVAERQSLISQVDSRLNARLRQLAGTYDAPSRRLTAAPDAATARGDEVVLVLTPVGRITQTEAAGLITSAKVPWEAVVRALRAVAQGRNGAVIEQGLTLTAPAGRAKAGVVPLTATRTAIYRLAGMPLSTGRRVTALLVVGLRSDVTQQLAALLRALETVVPAILALCAVGGYWLADRALHPVRAITRTARQISATDLSKRLNVQRRDELGQLGATLDHMFERLEAAFERQRQFTADASHELRTPLAIVDLEATRALARPRTPDEYRRAITIMQQETRYMTRLVQDLLTLARADSGEETLQRAEVDLGEVVLDVAERMLPLAQQSAMALTIGSLPDAPVYGDRAALSCVLANVVENALTYGAGHGTRVSISGGHRQQNGVAGVWLQVADDGPGIAAEHLPHVCDRFYRVDHARTHSPDTAPEKLSIHARPTGSGLGLAICQRIVGEHAGNLRINSASGHGVVADIWLPAGATLES